MTALMAMLRSIEGVFGGPPLPGECEHFPQLRLACTAQDSGHGGKHALCIGVLRPGSGIHPIGVGDNGFALRAILMNFPADDLIEAELGCAEVGWTGMRSG